MDSTLGQGTCFTILLPIAGVDSEGSEIEDDSVAEKKIIGGTETILIAGDEPSVGRTTSKLLMKTGYTMVVETDREEALQQFSKNPSGFDLLLTDMAMPKLPGDQLATEILKLRKDFPIILMKGYSKKINENSIKDVGIAGYIQKPFKGHLLLKKYARLLIIRSIHQHETS